MYGIYQQLIFLSMVIYFLLQIHSDCLSVLDMRFASYCSGRFWGYQLGNLTTHHKTWWLMRCIDNQYLSDHFLCTQLCYTFYSFQYYRQVLLHSLPHSSLIKRYRQFYRCLFVEAFQVSLAQSSSAATMSYYYNCSQFHFQFTNNLHSVCHNFAFPA